MDRITEVTEPVFNGLSQVLSADRGSLTMPELLHQQFSTFVEQASRAAKREGFSDSDAEDIRYALVALVDEEMLSKEGPLRDFWLPRSLQLQLYRENVAGDAFFTRLEAVRARGQSEVLLVYYLCLALGFRGKFRVRGGEVEVADLLDGLRKELISAGQIDPELSLAPHGERPYEAAADVQRNSLLLWLAVTAVAAAAMTYIGLQLSLTVETADILDRLQTITGGS